VYFLSLFTFYIPRRRSHLMAKEPSCSLFTVFSYLFLIPLWVFGYNSTYYYSVYVHHMSVVRTTFQIAVYAGGVRLTSFFDVIPCSTIDRYWRFGGTCRAYLQCCTSPRQWRQQIPSQNLVVHNKYTASYARRPIRQHNQNHIHSSTKFKMPALYLLIVFLRYYPIKLLQAILSLLMRGCMST
jgi:hypothetical protein